MVIDVGNHAGLVTPSCSSSPIVYLLNKRIGIHFDRLCPCTKIKPTMPTQHPPLHTEQASEPPPDPDWTVHPGYTIYLLTVWHGENNGSKPTQWRFRLENPRTKQGVGCVGVDALVEKLMAMIGEGR